MNPPTNLEIAYKRSIEKAVIRLRDSIDKEVLERLNEPRIQSNHYNNDLLRCNANLVQSIILLP